MASGSRQEGDGLTMKKMQNAVNMYYTHVRERAWICDDVKGKAAARRGEVRLLQSKMAKKKTFDELAQYKERKAILLASC